MKHNIPPTNFLKAGVITCSLAFILSSVLFLSSSLVNAQVDNSNKLVLVSGATGQQGGAVARELLKRGYKVRGLSRNPDSDKARKLSALGVEMVKGDFDDRASLSAALNGAWGAFSIQQWRHVGTDGEIRQSKAFADAALDAGVEHFVYTSVAAAPMNSGVSYFESKLVIETHIRSLGMSYSIIRPTSFMTNFERSRKAIESGNMRGPAPPEKRGFYIAVSDIGKFAAEAFDNHETWNGRILAIAGDTKTNTEIAAIFSEYLNKKVTYSQIPWEQFEKTAVEPFISSARWSLSSNSNNVIDVDALRKEFPWMLTVKEFLNESNWVQGPE